ncbi:hypothetical protein GCM10010329_82640 [Streptomyces spiroverticillatus]|uniref:Uncharacterized protein n=1 Tax=Streptomyces finlayi TaxID=67296 RepID=A0A918X9B6_9ACTN|nr:hypothetical protein [Streptomyces finlayi]GHA47711.1 hypothetical protein GCM10010329_82640 [Streptomyces spiroverticillatus]GHD18678.1 hypothetical protein GCM10010334_81710 [Streptomyces finlayi]
MPVPLLTTARRTAALLGVGWSAAPDPHWPRAALLTCPRPGQDPYQVRISDEDGRLVVYGLFDNHGDNRLNGITTPTISVTADMPARQLPRHLVAHLRRRFLPDYDTALGLAAETHARYKAQAAARDATVQLLLDAMPGSWVGPVTASTDRPSVHAPSQDPEDIGITAHIERHGDRVGLGLRNLTPEQAAQICRQLAPGQ